MSQPKEKLAAAIQLHKLGEFAAAAGIYRDILISHPAQPDALHLLGLTQHQRGEHAAAVATISEAIAVHPRESGFYANRGEALRALGQFAAAEADFRHALKLAPSAAAQSNLGLVLRAQEQFTQAQAAFAQAIAIKPAFPEAHNNLALLLQDMGDIEGAIRAFEHAVALREGFWEANNNLGAALRLAGRKDEALAAFEAGLAANPPPRNRADLMHHIAEIVSENGDHRRAADILEQAITLDPESSLAFNNLAANQMRLDAIEAAIANGRRAIELHPDNADAHRNLGINLLLLQRFEEGWREYAWRRKCRDFMQQSRPFVQPYWTGEGLAGLPLLVFGEQGVGDEIFYAAMVPDLLQEGMSAIIEVDPRLVPLFARSFPAARVVARSVPPAAITGEAAAQIAIGDLGSRYRNGIAQFALQPGYLVADAERSARVRRELGVPDGHRLVGISWSSSKDGIGRAKSAPLSLWGAILRTPSMFFVDLQYGDTAAERTAVADALGVSVHKPDHLDPFHDIDGLAAVISACDLVVTVSNTTAHLAGALGKPTWVLLGAHAGRFWYWGRASTHTPWYPSVVLFRQTHDGAWDEVIAAVASRLREQA